METKHSYSIFPLGDSALTIEFGAAIDPAINEHVLTLFHQFKKLTFSFLLDIVPAYSTLTIHYDPIEVLKVAETDITAFEAMSLLVETILGTTTAKENPLNNIKRIPVCYTGDYAPDLVGMADVKGLSVSEIITTHTAAVYRVYMIGFLPGFPYMGEVDDRIAMPRKAQPRTNVPAGAVGIAGRQTGIYSVESPGGWQIIGRTPLVFFDKAAASPSLLQPGDTVQFYSITEDEFESYKGRVA